MNADRCEGCGRAVEGGTAGCRAEFEAMCGRDFGDVRYGRLHRMMVDTYSVQHPDAYCASTRSLIAHLGGLCCGMEFERQENVYRALRLWIERVGIAEKPPLPAARGDVTIADALAAADPVAYADAVQRWARSAWAAHASLHAVARHWIDEALKLPAHKH